MNNNNNKVIDPYSLINKKIGYDFDGVLHKSIYNDTLNNIYVGPFAFQRTFNNNTQLIPNDIILQKIKFDITGNSKIYIITSIYITYYEYILNFLQKYFTNYELSYMTIYMKNDNATNLINLHKYVKFEIYNDKKIDVIIKENIIEFTDDSIGTICDIYKNKQDDIKNSKFLLYYSIPEFEKCYYKITQLFELNDFSYISNKFPNNECYDYYKVNSTINYFIKLKKFI